MKGWYHLLSKKVKQATVPKLFQIISDRRSMSYIPKKNGIKEHDTKKFLREATSYLRLLTRAVNEFAHVGREDDPGYIQKKLVVR